MKRIGLTVLTHLDKHAHALFGEVASFYILKLETSNFEMKYIYLEKVRSLKKLFLAKTYITITQTFTVR